MSFNPHTHAGCDPLPPAFPFVTILVSIHTPTQGVTIGGWSSVININVSIHTPTQGVTLTSAGAWSYQSMFQSTHPRRV